MNCLDLACIHAAAMGLDEAEGPDVVQIPLVAKLPQVAPEALAAIQRENRARLARIAKQRHPWRRKVVTNGV